MSELWKLEFINDAVLLQRGQPKRRTIKEVPYIKNNPSAIEGEKASDNQKSEK